MAFLAPLFLAGLAAVALPILLHLRKNRPKQTVAFSSLMFLEESPPITKTRSRVQDVLLLILRCLAIALLILAFARPFFPAKDKPVAPADGAVMNFILLDTSASMRGDPSEQARKIAANLISGFPEKDWIAVAGFSNQLRVLLDPERARNLPLGERKLAAQTAISTLQADWKSTRLDASLLAALAGAGQDAPLRIHLIGDLQKGAELERLRGEVWPGAVQIILHPVSPAEGWTNAGVSILPLDQQVQRARVINSVGSLKSDFTLAWSGLSEKTQISVPSGESAVFDAPPGIAAEGKLTLSGDDFTYDNETTWTTPAQPVAQVWSPDQAQAGDASEGAYFLSRALQSTPDYKVEITAEMPTKPPALTITSSSADVTAVLSAGGNVLFTMRDATSSKAISNMLGMKSGEAREAQVKNHVLFGEIDFKSPVFAPFADARYSDFSSIRTWKYRVLPADLIAKGRVLASFDSGDPAWLSFAVGKGTLHVLTTTWRPLDSQLALSTKFPPLLHALLSQAKISIGERGPLLVDETHDTPGIHRNASTAFTVQLDPAESERTPLPESELRALGLPLDPPKDFARSAEIAKEVSNAELESRQRLGWWLLVAAAVFFLAETIYAGMAGRHQPPATS
jgi:Aerotolerance regulator N-terminal/von Willebrand factor type A domain